ncbi:Putative indoleamine 2,3-dioxygenase [Septoria linicola]|uniref:Indoleamine 2,3-dioxygenase n=1 Tax=Septoria linicola TaxID=215465 RepID=A0A9Q9AMK5_9PEZI|nr:Putative indoleamine 2,3-dioxygenase [Septoria linicola]
MPPVITYTALILWNTKLVVGANSGFDIDNLEVCRSFTGTSDERWFHMICAAMEASAGPTMGRLLVASNAVAFGDAAALIDTLTSAKHTIQHLIALLQKLNRRFVPTIWYEQLRPLLAGGIDDRLAKGISFDNGNTYLKLAGANAGQSSLFQFFDAALGIEHSSDFAARMREYMPGPHARFLQATEESASTRQVVLDNAEDEKLQQAYNGCVEELELFRSKHIQIVSRYIVIPAREAARKKASQSLCEGVTKPKGELKGVGGAPLMPFLRGIRDETRQSSVCQIQP